MSSINAPIGERIGYSRIKSEGKKYPLAGKRLSNKQTQVATITLVKCKHRAIKSKSE